MPLMYNYIAAWPSYVSSFITSVPPTITYCNENRIAEELCLAIEFHDGYPKETVILKRTHACVYSGFFQNTDLPIAASSVDCSMNHLEVYISQN